VRLHVQLDVRRLRIWKVLGHLWYVHETTGGMNQAACLPCTAGKVSKQGSRSCSAFAAGKWAASAMACTEVIRPTLLAACVLLTKCFEEGVLYNDFSSRGFDGRT
jgi:hypothetical protein